MTKPSSSAASLGVRVQVPQRRQVEWRPLALDECLPSDHRARLVWSYVEGLDAGPLYAAIRAVAGGAGRDAVDPRILLALWMFATIEGVGSARHLARLCQRDVAYQWLCGGVGVNYHLLADFRTRQGEFLEKLLTDTVATLLHQGLVTLDVVAQDGLRVRAHAGSGSFRRQPTLEQRRQEVQQQLAQLRGQGDEGPGDEGAQTDADRRDDARRTAAQLRAAREREARIAQALVELEQVRQQKERNKKGSGEKARASMTDPEARIMKMADGGFRPAYNVQFASDGGARVIVGVDVTNAGSDAGQASPLHAQVSARYGKTPGDYLMDGGFVTHDEVTTLEDRGSRVHAPLPAEERMRRLGHDPYARQDKDTDQSFAFRQRMATPEAQAVYRERSSIAEYPNAECRNRGLHQFRVRGLAKVRTVALWFAVTFNFLRMASLGCLGRQAAPAS